jgi:hypothetical protein
MTITKEQVRKDFEKWAEPIFYDNPTWRESAACELAWQAFEAGRKSAVSEPVAYIRKWAFEKEKPVKERKENGRLAWPFKFKLLPVTKNQCLPDDVPLYATPPAAPLPLSDEQVGEVSYRCADVRGVRVDQFKFARAIEAAHGIVNIGAKE